MTDLAYFGYSSFPISSIKPTTPLLGLRLQPTRTPPSQFRESEVNGFFFREQTGYDSPLAVPFRGRQYPGLRLRDRDRVLHIHKDIGRGRPTSSNVFPVNVHSDPPSVAVVENGLDSWASKRAKQAAKPREIARTFLIIFAPIIFRNISIRGTFCPARAARRHGSAATPEAQLSCTLAIEHTRSLSSRLMMRTP